MVRVVCRSARDRPADQLQFSGLCRLCDDRVDVDGYMASETNLSVPDDSGAAPGPQAEATRNTTTGERPYVVFGYGSLIWKVSSVTITGYRSHRVWAVTDA